MATAVVQRGVAQFVCILLADPPQAGSLHPCRWCLHVEKVAAVSEAGGHTGTDQGGRHQQGEGQDAGAEQMHRHTTGLDENTKPGPLLIVWGLTCPVTNHDIPCSDEILCSTCLPVLEVVLVS